MLLSDTDVIHFVNENFVPCWQMVRPVPQVTISFGDGRTLKRTLAGNTVISILLPDGRVVDAFPGIYTPDDLVREVTNTLAFLKEHAGATPIKMTIPSPSGFMISTPSHIGAATEGLRVHLTDRYHLHRLCKWPP